MTRADIERDYRVVDGVIRSPGKFEGEMVYVPFYWEVFLNGFADRDDGSVLKFKVDPDDRKMFPELKGRHWVSLLEGEDGFVSEIFPIGAAAFKVRW